MTYNRTNKFSKGKNFNDKKKPFVQQPRGNKVIVIDGNVDQALRKFKKKVSNSGLIDDIKKKEFFEYIDANWEGESEKAEDTEAQDSLVPNGEKKKKDLEASKGY